MRRDAKAFVVLAALIFAACASHRPAAVPKDTEKGVIYSNAAFKDTTVIAKLSRSVSVWQKALAERTKAVVASGVRDLDEVKRLVCEQTATEEAAARKDEFDMTSVMMDGICTGMTQGGKKSAQLSPEQCKEMAPVVVDAAKLSNDRTFNKRRDKLIEKYFREAVGETSP